MRSCLPGFRPGQLQSQDRLDPGCRVAGRGAPCWPAAVERQKLQLGLQTFHPSHPSLLAGDPSLQYIRDLSPSLQPASEEIPSLCPCRVALVELRVRGKGSLKERMEAELESCKLRLGDWAEGGSEGFKGYGALPVTEWTWLQC